MPKAPYFPVGWIEKFLDLSRRININKVDRHFFSQYKIASDANGSKIVSGLKFLNIIDEDGKVVEENLKLLKVVGESRKEGFTKILKKSYPDIFETVNLTQAEFEDLVNYFIGHYSYTATQSKLAVRFFLYLLRKSDIEVSEKLKNMKLGEAREQSMGPKNKKELKTTKKRKHTESFKKVDVEPHDESGSIVIHVRGKGLSLDLTINSLEEIQPNLEIVSKMLNMNLKRGNDEK